MKKLIKYVLRCLGFEVTIRRVSVQEDLPKEQEGFNDFNDRIVFVHIPKCGGTSIDDAIRRQIGRKEEPRVQPVAARRAGIFAIQSTDPIEFSEAYPHYLQYLLVFHLNCDWRFISGHLPVNKRILDEFGRKCAFITVLRNPVERWISNYLFNKMRNPDPMAPPSIEYEGSLEEEILEVIQSRLGWLHANVITMMIGGRYPLDEKDAIEIREEVIQNLKKFKLVGFLDDMGGFEKQFYDLFGIHLGVKRLNRTNRDLSESELAKYRKIRELLEEESIYSEIERLCRTDLDIYNTAKDSFTQLPLR